MFKSILSVLGGTAIGVFTISLVQYMGTMLYPLPPHLNVQDPAAMGTFLTNAPLGSLFLVLMAYALGSFLAGMVASRYAPSKPVLHALLAGVILLFFGIVNLWLLPHPLWFVVTAVLVFLPMACFGGTMSFRRMP